MLERDAPEDSHMTRHELGILEGMLLKKRPRTLSTKERKHLIKVCKAGLPPRYRKHLWLRASGAAALMNMPENRFYYQKLKRIGLNYPTQAIHQIEVDVTRTLSEMEIEPSAKTLAMLKNVLTAYTVRCPQISYCQGMNFLVARILKQTMLESE